jgi:hypothetical protein
VTVPETVTFGAVTVLDGHDGHGRSPSPDMNFTVIITVDVRPDRIDEFVAGITTNAIASLRDEPGCLAFDVHRDQASGPHRRSGVSAAGPPGGGQDQLGRAVAHVGRGTALQQRGRNVGHIRVLVDLAVHADPEARRLIREAGRHIGEVLAGAVNLLNPDALVITGDMAKAYDIFVAGLRETVYGNATAVATRERRGDPRTTDPALHPRRPIRRDRQRGDDSRPRSVCRSYGRFDLTDSYRI